MPRFSLLSTLSAAAATFVAAVLLAVFAAGEGRRFAASLNLAAPLVSVDGEVAPPPPRLARRVLLVLVDGLRLDSSRTMAFLDAVRARGVDGVASSHYPTISLPNYVSILAGVPPRYSGLRNNAVSTPVALDTVMARARDAGLRAAYATDFTYGGGVLFVPMLDEAAAVPWPGMFERTVAGALARDTEFLVIHFGQVDKAGHADGATAPSYQAAVDQADGILTRQLASFDWSRDALVVVADHGHVDSGGHGGLEPEVTQVPLLLAGAGIVPGAVPRDARLIDVAPTVCALLGLAAPRHSLGRTLTEVLAIDPAIAARLGAADAARAATLTAAATAAANQLEARAWLFRLVRAITALMVVICGVVLVRWLARTKVIVLDRRVLMIAVPTYPLTFYGLLAAFEPFLTPSMLPGEGDILMLLLRYGVIAAGANLLAVWLAVAWRTAPRDRLAAATGVVLVGLLVSLAPAGLAWTIVSPPFAAEVPGPTMMVLPPVLFAGVACFAASAALALLAEWAVYASRVSAN